MSPLRNAMGLVDGEQADGRLSQQAQKSFGIQAFRRDIEHVQFAREKLPFDGALGIQRQ